MADIIKCSNKNCLFKKDCFRYTAPPNQCQSYQCFDDRTDGCVNLCIFFMLNDNNEQLQLNL